MRVVQIIRPVQNAGGKKNRLPEGKRFCEYDE